jgi:hypothetical protein
VAVTVGDNSSENLAGYPSSHHPMTIQANIPDFLIRQATDVARREGTSVDSIIAIALSSQVAAWQVRDSGEYCARRGRLYELDETLSAVPGHLRRGFRHAELVIGNTGKTMPVRNSCPAAGQWHSGVR